MKLGKSSDLTGADFKVWRKSLALTQDEAAKALGLKLRMIQNYEKGTHPIPRTTALACWALSKGRIDFVAGAPVKLKKPLALHLAGKDEKLKAKKIRKLKLNASKLN